MIDTQHLHPMMVHSPIALLIFGLLADSDSDYILKRIFFQKPVFYYDFRYSWYNCMHIFSGNLTRKRCIEF